MIIKGGSRAAPKQLAYHLQRRDTNDRVEILELNALSDTVEGALYDWQTMAEATRSPNPRGLYHANIDPAEQYTLTPEQKARAVDLLEEELGLQGQPRLVIQHEKYGREHLHVVWCRTDYEKCILKRDNNNYYAHERVSQKLELEFGHEPVPGKFAKRDREKQPEFPRSEFNHAEWQQSERSGLDPAERKKQIRAIHATVTNGQEFKEALEGGGYTLAQGERGYLVVDPAGDHSVLSRNLKMRKVDVDAFMADVPLNKLPTVEEAKALQRDKDVAAEKAAAPPETPDAPKAEPREMSQAERKEQITGIRKSCDNAQAFKNALEETGYVLAKGDRRGYVLVDGAGEVHSLSRHVTDIKGKEFKTFMAPVDMTALPNIEEAKAIQARRQQEAAAKAEKRSQERSKFLSDELAQKIQQPTPAPEKPPEQARQEETSEASQGIEASKFLRPVTPQQEVQPPAPMPGPEASKFLRPQRPQQAPVLAPPPAPADTARAEETYHTPMPPEGRDLETERRNREKQRAAELRAEIEQREIAEQASKFLRPPEPESTATPVKAVPVPPPAPQKTKRRAPVPSDPWMAQVGGADKLSPAHLASAQRSYEAWAHKDRYDFRDYVSYVQKQWEDKELPPPQIQTPTLRTPAAQPAPVPKPADWTERELTPEFPALKAPTQPEPPKREGEPEEIYKIRKEIWQRQVSQMDEHAKANAEEYKRAEATGANKSANELEDFDHRQREARHEAQEQIQPAPKPGWRGALDRILNPVDEQKKAAEQQEQLELLQARQAQERRDYIRKLEQDRARELEALRDKQLQEQAAREKEFDKDLERHLREKKRALELQREMETEQREKELNREKEEGLGEGKE